MKTILITGGSSGIGKATTLRLAQLGHRVIAVARNEKRLQSLKNENNKIDTVAADRPAPINPYSDNKLYRKRKAYGSD